MAWLTHTVAKHNSLAVQGRLEERDGVGRAGDLVRKAKRLCLHAPSPRHSCFTFGLTEKFEKSDANTRRYTRFHITIPIW